MEQEIERDKKFDDLKQEGRAKYEILLPIIKK
jgi:hypothetical protein